MLSDHFATSTFAINLEDFALVELEWDAIAAFAELNNINLKK